MTDPDIAWMVDRLGVYAARILASEHADQLVSDLLGSVDDDGVKHGDLWGTGRRLAFRAAGGRGITVQCPSCPLRVRLDPDAEWIACTCGEGGVLAWWRTMLAGDLDAMRADALADWLKMTHRITLKPGTFRLWVHRGVIDSTGCDDQGRKLYDPLQVAVVALKRREMSA